MLHGIVIEQRRDRAGLPLLIECPCCGQIVQVEPTERLYEDRLVNLVPIMTHRVVVARCPSCGNWLRSPVPLEELNGLDNSEPIRIFRPYVSFVAKFLTVTTLLLFCTPFITPILGAIAVGMTRSSKRWRRAAIVGLVLSSLVSVGMIAMLIFDPPKR